MRILLVWNGLVIEWQLRACLQDLRLFLEVGRYIVVLFQWVNEGNFIVSQCT